MRLIPLTFGTLWVLACGYALIRGGHAERIAAGVFVIAALLTPILDGADMPYQSVERGVMAVDIVMLAVLLALALRTARYWPMLMASFQLAQVGTHAAKWLAPDTLPAGYFVLTVLWSYPMLILLGVATFRHRQRLSAYGIDHDWAASLPPLYLAGHPLDGQEVITPRP